MYKYRPRQDEHDSASLSIHGEVNSATRMHHSMQSILFSQTLAWRRERTTHERATQHAFCKEGTAASGRITGDQLQEVVAALDLSTIGLQNTYLNSTISNLQRDFKDLIDAAEHSRQALRPLEFTPQELCEMNPCIEQTLSHHSSMPSLCTTSACSLLDEEMPTETPTAHCFTCLTYCACDMPKHVNRHDRREHSKRRLSCK